MNTHKQITEELLNHPLQTSLFATSALLLICSGYIKPPITVALVLLGIVVYSALYLGHRLQGVLPAQCRQQEKSEA